MKHYGPINTAAAQLVATGPQDLLNIQGYYAGADGKYLQIHNAAAVADIGDATIIKSYYLQGAFVFSWSFAEPLSLSLGCVVAVSEDADPAKYTAYTGTATDMTLTADLNEVEVPLPSGYSTAGDLTTGVDELEVNATETTPIKLYQVDVINGLGAAGFLCLFGRAAANFADGDVPIAVFPLANVATVQTFKFGHDFVPRQMTGTTSGGITGAGDVSYGCSLAVSEADANGDFGGVLAEKGDSASYIRAYYK